jgi:hypothetical protein
MEGRGEKAEGTRSSRITRIFLFYLFTPPADNYFRASAMAND